MKQNTKEIIIEYICGYIAVFVGIGIFASCLLITGCIDRAGYYECFKSYDNLILKDGWEIIEHSSDFVTSAEGRYFVTFHIHNWSSKESKYVYGFIYDVNDDKLIYSPDGLTPDLPKEVISDAPYHGDD